MTLSVAPRGISRSLLTRLFDAPALVHRLRALPAPEFAALVRRVGVEDAGELVALATAEQLVAAFDEDLFTNTRPGERETLDPARFSVWLEVLLEAGDAAAAARMAQLSEDFVAHGLSSLVLVVDHEALIARMGEGDAGSRAADKAIESCHSEELDGYLLISRVHDGWDAALALVLALDRDHRSFLERVLDRCARASAPAVDDLDELVELLSEADSLADDVEGDREDRRARQGYVDPSAARSFLVAARRPPTEAAGARDPVTRRYFRELDRPVGAAQAGEASPALLVELGEGQAPLVALARADNTPERPLVAAMRLLADGDPSAFEQRVSEMLFLTNVLLAGAKGPRGRLRPVDAGEAVLATVGFGAALQAGARGTSEPQALCDVLHRTHADQLFRQASHALTRCGRAEGVLWDDAALATLLATLPQSS